MIYITGDTHGSLDSGKLFQQPHIKTGDYVIICGDFGYIWSTNPKNAEELKSLRKLAKLPYTMLFIDGNHENFERLFSNEFETVEMFGSQVKQIKNNIFYLQRGRRYVIDGYSFLTIGGALSIDKQHRIQNISWWAEELLNKSEEDNVLDLISQNAHFDYILTHAAPASIVNKLYEGFSSNQKLQDPSSVFLEHLLSQVTFKKWFCGHYHEDTTYTVGNSEIRLVHDDIVKIDG